MRSADRQFIIEHTELWGHGCTYWHNQNVLETYGFRPAQTRIRYVLGYYHPEQVDEFLGRGSQVGIVHWLGTDVMQALETRRLPPAGVVNFCDSFDLQRELATLGLVAKVVIHRPRHRVEAPLPLPDQQRVAIYMPPTRHDFFRYELMCDVEQVLRDDWGWDVVWLDMSEAELNAGGRDIPALLASSSHLLRCPIHDGFSHTAAEFILAGRSVVTTAERPFQIMARPEVVDICQKLKAPPFASAPAFYRWWTDPDRLYEALWDAWLDSQ